MNQNAADNAMENGEISLTAARRSAFSQFVPLLCIGLGILVLFEAGAAPMLDFNLGDQWRMILGAQGIALFLLGTVLAVQKKDHSGLDEKSLFHLYGLKGACLDDVFQDFDAPDSEESTLNHLWADAARGSRVCACVDKNGKFLRIEFLNGNNARPCGVCIRGKQHRALIKRPDKKYLCFEARVPKGEPRFTRPNAQQQDVDAPKRAKQIGLTVRVVNGRLQHWVWSGDATVQRQLTVEGPSWKQVKIPLNRAWERFLAEGNPGGPARPDFTVISAVILEIGSAGSDEPGEGYGNLDVRHFRCESD